MNNHGSFTHSRSSFAFSGCPSFPSISIRLGYLRHGHGQVNNFKQKAKPLKNKKYHITNLWALGDSFTPFTRLLAIMQKDPVVVRADEPSTLLFILYFQFLFRHVLTMEFPFNFLNLFERNDFWRQNRSHPRIYDHGMVTNNIKHRHLDNWLGGCNSSMNHGSPIMNCSCFAAKESNM